MIDRIRKIIENDGRIYIMGAGKSGIDFFYKIRSLFPRVQIVFLDNNEVIQHEGIQIDNVSLRVFSPDIIKNTECVYLVVITSEKYYSELLGQLYNLGISEDCVALTTDCMNRRLDEYYGIIKKRRPRKNLNFVVDLAEHCNLNCQNCDHFSPLAEERYTDLIQFEKDIQRMSEIFSRDITHVDLEGGEPLLNKNVCDYIKIVNKHLPHSGIKIFTNGLLLPKMDEYFWETCSKYDVELEVTQYPLDFDYEAVELLAKNHGVRFHVYDGKSGKESWHKPLDLDGGQDRYNSFDNCYLANGDCTMLKNGKLYPCTLIPNLETFNRYFNKNLLISEKDYIDIYSDISKEEVYEFLCNPPMACRYCKVCEWTNGHKWGISKKDIVEWT